MPGAYCKINITYHLLFNIEIIHSTSGNIQLRFASLNISYLGWIIPDIKQKGIKYLLNDTHMEEELVLC